jgi:hypothetical protein
VEHSILYEPRFLEPRHNAGTADRETNLGTTRVRMNETHTGSGRHSHPTTVWPEMLRTGHVVAYAMQADQVLGRVQGLLHIHTSTQDARIIGDMVTLRLRERDLLYPAVAFPPPSAYRIFRLLSILHGVQA